MPRLGPSPTQKVNQLLEAAAHARLPFEKDWWLNIAFYLGNQYTQWNPKTNIIEELPRTPKTRNIPRPVANKINHFVNQQHAFALQAKPVADVIPVNDNPITQSNAQVALSYAEYSASPQIANYEHQQSIAVLWALVCGPGYFKWCWDTDRKRPSIEALSPFDVYLDPYATNWDQLRYVIQSSFMDPEQVYDRYGVKPQAKAERQDPTRAKYLREMGQAPILEGVSVHELWQRPTRTYPKGRWVVWSGHQVIEERNEIPYTHLRERGGLPFTQIGVIPRPGSIFYDSHVKYMRPQQIELNKYHSQKLLMRENFANLKWFIPDELEMNEDPDDSGFQILRGHSDVAGLKPEMLTPPALPDTNDGDWIKTEMSDTVGLHEISQAQAPGRVESAKALELLKESDANRLSELLRTVSASISEGYWQTTMLGKQYEDDGKMILIYSPDGVHQVRRFLKDDIDPGTQFMVTMGTGLAWSRSARADQVMRLAELGIQIEPERIFQLLDVPGPLALSEDAYDVRRARDENMQLANPELPPPMANSWDNHPVHLREHNRYRKTQEYQLLSGDEKQQFEYHCEGHEKMYEDFLKREGELAMLAQGVTPGMPPPEQGGDGSAPPTQAAPQTTEE